MRRGGVAFITLSVILGLADPTPSLAARKNKAKTVTSDRSESSAERHRILLSSGENKTVDIDFDLGRPEQVTIGNPQIVGYTIAKVGEEKQIVFNPLKAGETTVTLRDPEGKIRVIYTVVITGSNLLRRKAELATLLRDIEGVDIKVIGSKILVDGEILVPSDYARLLGVVQDDAYAKLVINLATLSPLAIQVLSQKIKQDINAFAPDVYTRVVNGMIFLEGTVDDGDKLRRAEEIAKLYLPEAVPGNQLAIRAGDTAKKIDRKVIQNFIVVSAAPPKKPDRQVRVTIHFVKLTKSYLRSFGFNWQPGITAGSDNIVVGTGAAGATGASGASFSATISNLFPKLRTAQEAGFAKVLRTGTVVVRNGQPASLTEKSSIPFVGVNTLGQPTNSFADVGVDFSVTPEIQSEGDNVLLDLNLVQVSQEGRRAGNGPPPTSKHEVKTKLYVKSAESAAVAGITSDDVSTDFNRDPSGSFEGKTEPLFNLKRSKDYNKNRSQYVIFVTPQIISDAAEATEDLKKNFRVKVK